MKLFKLIPAVVLGALTLSSCSDFLQKDSEDSLEVDQYLTSEDNLKSFTYQLYGPYTWNTYETKFSWCANELTVGNVYHNYGDEGAFFFLNFDNTNAQLLDGYQGLYGVIGRCNMIINEMPSTAKANGISDAAINRAKGEAYMFRGMAYFLLTEYWGETYIVLNNSTDIANDNSFNVPKASRRCLYAQIEKDWTTAADLLPADRWGTNGERATKASAYGMLAKLYLTMASAATANSAANVAHPFTAEKTDVEYYGLSKTYADKALDLNNFMESGSNFENIFWPKTFSKEVLFSLHFEQGPYGAGSSRQVHFARSKYLDGGDDYYGGEKGLTVTLFNSFDNSDVRKAATSYFTLQDNDKVTTDRKPGYKLYDGSTYYYYYNPNKSFGTNKQPFGAEPEGPVLNHCRKFVYSIPLTNKFSAPLSIPFLRVPDLYLMKAEAEKALATGGADVTKKTTAGDEYINKIRERAGLGDITNADGVALYDTDPETSMSYTYNNGTKEVTVSCPTYSDTYDLLEERRHEFALECQNWLDLKRIYYRNAGNAVEFLKHEDRGYTYGVSLGNSYATQRSQYERQALINAVDPTQTKETPIDVTNVEWFFPLPSSIAVRGSKTVFDDIDKIKNGSYEY